MKKLLSLALMAGTAGIAFAAAKIIGRRNATRNDAERNDISDAFYEANHQRENGDITEEEYQEKLNAIHRRAEASGAASVNALLEEAYFEAVYTADCHAALMLDVEEANASSLEDFIKKAPHKAYENGVLNLTDYDCEKQVRATADYLAEEYYRELDKKERQLFEYVEMLGGDTNKISQEFDKIRENNIF